MGDGIEHDDMAAGGAHDALLQAVGRELRRPVTAAGDFDARVMAAVRAAGPPAGHGPAARRGGALGWLVRPRTVRLSPLAGLLAAASLAAVAVAGTRALRPGEPAPAMAAAPAAGESVRLAADPGAGAGARRAVRFVLRAPAAGAVALVGDFNDWDAGATPLRAIGSGAWAVEHPLAAGRHEYAFVVDGRVVRDPLAPAAPAGDFGPANAVVTVEAP